MDLYEKEKLSGKISDINFTFVFSAVFASLLTLNTVSKRFSDS